MIGKIKKFIISLKNDKSQKILSNLLFFSIFLYFAFNILSFANFFPNLPNYFSSSSTIGLLTRSLTSVMVIFFSFLIYITNWLKADKKWILIVLFLIVATGLMILVTPTSFYEFYLTEQYAFMATIKTTVSFKTLIIMYFSSCVDLLFGYCFLFIFPFVFTKKHIVFIGSTFLALILYSCFYSFIFERNYYIGFLSGNWSYTNSTIGSIFGNKQQWGIFLTVAIPTSVLLIFYVYNSEMKKSLKILLIFFYILTIILSCACGIISFCKTAIVSYVMFFVILIFGLPFLCLKRKKTRWISVIIFTIISIFVTVFILLLFTNIFENSKLYKILHNVIETLNARSEGSILIRFNLIYYFIENIPSVNLFFGIPKGVLDPYFRSIAPQLTVGLHTGIVIFLGRYGVFGVIIYLLLNLKIFKEYHFISKFYPIYSLLLISAFICSIILNLSESEILIFSSSMNGFIFNLLIISSIRIPLGDKKYEKLFSVAV